MPTVGLVRQSSSEWNNGKLGTQVEGSANAERGSTQAYGGEVPPVSLSAAEGCKPGGFRKGFLLEATRMGTDDVPIEAVAAYVNWRNGPGVAMAALPIVAMRTVKVRFSEARRYWVQLEDKEDEEVVGPPGGETGAAHVERRSSEAGVSGVAEAPRGMITCVVMPRTAEYVELMGHHMDTRRHEWDASYQGRLVERRYGRKENWFDRKMKDLASNTSRGARRVTRRCLGKLTRTHGVLGRVQENVFDGDGRTALQANLEGCS